MSKRKLEPNSVVKFGLGFLFLGLGFYTFFAGKLFANGSGIASLNLFTFAYFIVTFGEIALSPIGLSLMTKLSTQKLQGVMMGMWFLASAYGQYVACLLYTSIADNISSIFGWSVVPVLLRLRAKRYLLIYLFKRSYTGGFDIIG